MSVGTILSFALGVLGPVALAVACVFEFLARRTRKDPRCDKSILARQQKTADVGLVAAWLLFAAAYVAFQTMAPDAAVWERLFQKWMTWVIGGLLVLDVLYLVLRRSRPRKPGQKKQFWEI